MMSDRSPDARAAAGRLWFLSEPDALLRRFVMRTLLQPPRPAYLLRARGRGTRRTTAMTAGTTTGTTAGTTAAKTAGTVGVGSRPVKPR
jgi:hypothetical protein